MFCFIAEAFYYYLPEKVFVNYLSFRLKKYLVKFAKSFPLVLTLLAFLQYPVKQKRDKKQQLSMPIFEFVSTTYGILITKHNVSPL